MKAIVYYKFGSPDVLQYEEIDKPTPGDRQVLIKVRAGSVNPLDCGELKGVPYIFRLIFGCPIRRSGSQAGQALIWQAWLKRLAEVSRSSNPVTRYSVLVLVIRKLQV